MTMKTIKEKIKTYNVDGVDFKITENVEKALKMEHPNRVNLSNILSLGMYLNLIIASRGVSKTYGAKLEMIMRFITKGEKSVYVVRSGKQYDMAKVDFWGTIQQQYFPMLELNQAGDMLLINGLEIGFIAQLSSPGQYNGPEYQDYSLLIFDEFIESESRRYISKTEFEGYFMRLLVSIQRDKSNFQVVLLGNNLMRFNPYFEKLGVIGCPTYYEKGLNADVYMRLPELPDGNTLRYLLLVSSRKHTKGYKLTPVGCLMRDTGYDGMAVDNEITDIWTDNDAVLEGEESQFSEREIDFYNN